MRAELKNIMTTGVLDFIDFYPENAESFCVDIEAYIGLKNSDISNMFLFRVVTAKWLHEKFGEDDAVFLRHMLLVKCWSHEKIKSRIRKLLESFDFITIEDLASEVSKYGRWELER